MRSRLRWLVLAITLTTAGTFATPAAADHGTRPNRNMQALGHSPHPAAFTDPPPTHINSDLAFWGNLAFNGNYNGFRIIDISNPANPNEIIWYADCTGGQGDLVVWDNILVRSWDAPAPSGATCGGQPVPQGWEGLHVFDISNLLNPVLVGSLELECGSHTATLAGVEGGNLILYNNISSSFRCAQQTGNPQSADDPLGDFMDIVAVPLANPGGIHLIRREPLEGPSNNIRTGCHDVGVIRLNVNKAVCASADTINVWDIGQNNTPGGTLTDPVLLFTITEPGVGAETSNDPNCPACTGRWHSGTFTWDGTVIDAGWEPGGGAQAECEADDPPVDKSMFFYDARNGAKLGQWVLPRPQGADENCTIHNFNVVPMRNNRYIAVGGHYQAGTWVVDFTNPAQAQTLAWSDPPSLGPGPFCDQDGPAGPQPGTCQLGGAWSSYWYNDFVYESDITKGLNVFRVTHNRLANELTVNQPFLNPQTQMAGPVCRKLPATHIGTNAADVIVGTPEADVIVGLGGKDRIVALKGDDIVCAGKGKDKVSGSGGADLLKGQKGKDNLRGGAGPDVLAGGKGRDRCHGGPGRDKARRSCEKVLQVP